MLKKLLTFDHSSHIKNNMGRRAKKNQTNISRIEGIQPNDVYIGYICVQCNTLNMINIGQKLLDPQYAYQTQKWICKECGFEHSKDNSLSYSNWPEESKKKGSVPVQRFWQAFFRVYTENKEAYWKQCNCCGKILPFSAFSKHSGFGPLERQMECRACKGVINASLNPERTKEQLRESSVRRRIADLFVPKESKIKDDKFIKDLFKRFDSKCFKTKKPLKIEDRESWAIDHILPSKYLYPLTKENAALLSSEANSNKRDRWPSEFYTNNELIELSAITGADLQLLTSKKPIINPKITSKDVNAGVDNYLSVREKSNLEKRVAEIKKIIIEYNLIDKLTEANRKKLGLD